MAVRPATSSLTKRVLIYSSVWSTIAVLLLGWILLGMYRSSVERSFADLQLAQLYALVARVEASADGGVTGSPDLGDRNFTRANSGWYWRVFPLGRSDQGINSPSLKAPQIERMPLETVPFDAQFLRRYQVPGPNGEQLRIIETEIVLSDDVVGVFQVSGNADELERTISDYGRQIAGLLFAFVIGLVVINALVILFGLRPLDQLRAALSDIREGKSKKLEGRFPSEIQPVADELNVMIANNRRILERSRTQVGNLAHSLKTPLAVMLNAARGKGKTVESAMIDEQASAMQMQVQTYLDRARVAAQRDTAVYRTDASATAKKLVGVLQKLHPDIEISMQIEETPILFAGEAGDFEEIIGNLLENACKWSRAKVHFELGLDKKSDQALVCLRIGDDGHGIPKTERSNALKRGARLDETVPGTGLGLSIVNDTVKSYNGDVVLGESQLGGLLVEVALPALVSDQ